MRHNFIQGFVPLYFSDVQMKGKNLRAVDDVLPYCHLQYLLQEQEAEVETGLVLLATGL